MTHSLASDGGMWTEQVPPLLQAGFRVLRIDMRGHGGSGPVAGDYTMSALASDVAAVLDALSIQRVHFIGLSIGGMLGQAFALEHGDKLASAMWCDTLPASPAGAPEVWQQRVDTVRGANSLAHDHRHHAGGLSRLRRRHSQVRLRGAIAVAEAAVARGVRVGRCGHAGCGQSAAGGLGSWRPL
jgi:pimeloyl-ACP methyl ester carboxylesterase